MLPQGDKQNLNIESILDLMDTQNINLNQEDNGKGLACNIEDSESPEALKNHPKFDPDLIFKKNSLGGNTP